jgi:serine/threonine protein kinase
LIGARYRVHERIGSGGMAEVFRAQDEVLDRPVAVKVFRAEHVAHDGSETANGIERQQLEVAALARLNHPNLIALYDGSLDAAPHAFIVMELIEGPSLAAQIAQGPLPEASVREIGIQLADGLAYVHAQGMVHRDVKPENILLGVDRSDDDHTVRARLSDFGIVRLLGTERLTSVNFTLGTASYLAPEQARGSAVDPPADIYSLGLVLLEALTGQRMFDGAPLEAAMARLSQRPQIPAELPEPWPGLLYAMTEFDPAARPTATEISRVLRNEGSRALPLVPLAVPVAAGMADAPTGMVPAMVDPVPAADEMPPRRRRRVSAMAIAAALSLLVILTTLGIFLFTGNDSNSPAVIPPAGGGSPAAQKSDTHSTGKSGPSSGASSAPGTTSSATHAKKSASTSSAPSTSSARSSAGSSSAPASHPATSAPHTSTAHTTAPAPSTSATTPTSVPSTSSSAPATQSSSNSAATTSSPPA